MPPHRCVSPISVGNCLPRPILLWSSRHRAQFFLPTRSSHSPDWSFSCARVLLHLAASPSHAQRVHQLLRLSSTSHLLSALSFRASCTRHHSSTAVRFGSSTSLPPPLRCAPHSSQSPCRQARRGGSEPLLWCLLVPTYFTNLRLLLLTLLFPVAPVPDYVPPRTSSSSVASVLPCSSPPSSPSPSLTVPARCSPHAARVACVAFAFALVVVLLRLADLRRATLGISKINSPDHPFIIRLVRVHNGLPHPQSPSQCSSR